MKDVILKYYLPVFSISLPMVIIPSIQYYEKPDFNILVIVLASIVVGCTLIIGTILYFFRDKWEIKHNLKQLNKTAFMPFKEAKGFQITGEYLVGFYENYIVYITTKQDDLGRVKWVEFTILIHPKRDNQFILQKVFDDLNAKRSKEHTFYSNSLVCTINYMFRLPKFLKMKKVLDAGIAILNKNKLEPIHDIDLWHKLTEDLKERHLKYSRLRLK